jgi:hypothetical protein
VNFRLLKLHKLMFFPPYECSVCEFSLMRATQISVFSPYEPISFFTRKLIFVPGFDSQLSSVPEPVRMRRFWSGLPTDPKTEEFTDFIHSAVCLRQVHSLLQSEFTTESDLVLPLSNSSILKVTQ